MVNLVNFIQEKYLIDDTYNPYTCQPKDKFELRKILEERLAKNKNANLNDIDVSKITDMGFDGFPCKKGLFEDLDPYNIDISGWDVSNVTDMRYIFNECEHFDTDLSNWDVSKVTDMAAMFRWCINFTGKGLENWNVSNVTNMSYMFYKCTNFNCNLNKWKTSKVKYRVGTFYKCDSLINTPTWYKG